MVQARLISDNYTKRKLLIALGMVVVIVVFGYYIFASHAPSTTLDNNKVTTTTPAIATTNNYSVLSPATVPSKTPECSEQLTYDSSGDSGPLTCENGDINTLEWNALSALEPTIMTLGYSPTVAQVQAALCKDASDSDSDANTTAANTIEATTYQITALYYGWTFSPSPTSVLSNSGC